MKLYISLIILFLNVTQASLKGSTNEAEIRILHTELDIYVTRHDASLHGVASFLGIVEKPGEGGIRFHAYWLGIDSVMINEEPALLTFFPLQGIEYFYVYLPEETMIGDTVDLQIWYTRSLADDAPGREDYREGYYFFKKGDSRWGQTASETISYTMSQPNDARAWFPTIDEPSNKAPLTFHITVSEPSFVVANGELLHVTYNDDNSVTYIFDHPFPIAPYLTAFIVGPFEEFSETYTSIDGREIPISTYVYEIDAARAQVVNTLTQSQLAIFEELFGPYPFDRYGIIAIEPFRYGGMEHQTITAMRRSVVESERILAHELAHSWWGNMVTCYSWKDIWLNEGFASYSEALYEEIKIGIERRNEVLQFFATTYFHEDAIIRYTLHDPPPSRLFGTAIYRKGAWVLHMLRSIIESKTGDENLFFTALRQYGMRYQYGNATTDDLQTVFEEVTNIPLDWFFSQWVYQAGYPIYRYNVYINGSVSDNAMEITISLEQLQENAPDVFIGPIDFRIFAGEVDSTVTFWNDERTQEFVFNFPAVPDSILFDPDKKILKKVETEVVSVKDEIQLPSTIRLLQNFPNPFNASTIIQYELPISAYVRLRIVDAIGREIAVLEEGRKEAGVHSIRFAPDRLASGAYFVILNVNDISKVRKILYLK